MNQAVEYRTKLQTIRTNLLAGRISYDEARIQAQPVLDAINAKGREIAKAHGRRYQPISFSGAMR